MFHNLCFVYNFFFKTMLHNFPKHVAHQEVTKRKALRGHSTKQSPPTHTTIAIR